MNDLLLIALPYASMGIFVAGLIWRFRSRLTISSQSSFILEKRWLLVGAVPFHIGIVVLVLGHLVPLLIPGPWRTLVSNRSALLAVETIGSAAAMLVLIGLTVLLVRRIFSARVFAASSVADGVVLLVLIAQAGLGFAVAVLHRWGSVWSVGTTTPYLRSLFAFQPEPALVAGVPPLMMAHLAGAWIVLALIPFTRLVHLFTFPLRSVVRRPQKVVWAKSA